MHAGKTRNSQARVIGPRPKWPRSAYSASAPVIASTTAAREKNAVAKCPARKPTAYVGDSALSTSGCCAMPDTPHAAMIVNQPIITGPKRSPTRRRPSRWEKKSARMIVAVIGTTRWPSEGWATLSPSTADRTEIAGVIMLSPKKREAPKMPSAGEHELGTSTSWHLVAPDQA